MFGGPLLRNHLAAWFGSATAKPRHANFVPLRSRSSEALTSAARDVGVGTNGIFADRLFKSGEMGPHAQIEVTNCFCF